MKAAILTLTILLPLTLAACGGMPAIDLPSGTTVAVRLDRSLSTVGDRTGDTFGAILAQPVVRGGKEILPSGTRFAGHITTSESSGRLDGRAVLGVTLDAFDVNGSHYPISTSIDSRTSEGHKKRNIEVIGGGAGLGALIGGLTGGGKGAGIGAGIGAGAGTGVAAATGKMDVEVSAATVLRFSLTSPVGTPH